MTATALFLYDQPDVCVSALLGMLRENNCDIIRLSLVVTLIMALPPFRASCHPSSVEESSPSQFSDVLTH
jgi:hypothetical protein